MAKEGLTDLGLRKLSAPARGQAEVWAARVPGFGVRVSPSGTKAFVLVYRFDGRPRRMTLGRYPTLSLQDARWLAHEALRTLALGTDPAEKVGRDESLAVVTFAAFVELFMDAYAVPKNKSAHDTRRLLQREFTARWGDRPLANITRQDVASVLDAIMRDGRHTMANRALAAIRKLFNWAVERGHLVDSPCSGIRKPANEISRDRVLNANELRAIWMAAEKGEYPFAHIVQLLILTGQRRSEVASMRWSGLDFDEHTWSIASEQTKAGRGHLIPLGPTAEKIVLAVPRLPGDLVFPSRGRDARAFSGFGKCKERLDAASGVSNWRLHDLRRTFATMQARLGTSPHVTERILNHQVGSLTSVAKIYNRYSYLPEMKEAFLRYEDEVHRLIDL